MSEATDGFDLDEFFADIKPTIGLAKICPDGDLLDRHAALEVQLQQELTADALRNKGKKAPGIAAKMEALEAEIKAAFRTFRFQSIGRHAYRKLKGEHPPRDEDREAGSDVNAETFPIALIAASSLAPKLTVAQAERLDRDLNDSQFTVLFSGALNANLGVVVEAPKSDLASAVLHLRSAAASTTSSPGGSLPASGTDDAGDLSTSTSTTTPDG